MVLLIEIHNHRNHEKVKAYCEEKLNKHFGGYNVITTCKLYMSREGGVEPYEAKLEINTKLGQPIFAQDRDMNEHKVLDNVIKKAKRQLAKTKEKRYHNVGRIKDK